MSAERSAIQLRQFLGTWGCQSRMLGAEELIEVAKMAFDVPGTNVVVVAAAVERLGMVERSARVREAIRRHWPEPTVLWPARAPVRKSLARED